MPCQKRILERGVTILSEKSNNVNVVILGLFGSPAWAEG